MAKINPNLLIDQEWTGTFFPPEREDIAFAGKLKYSPTNGLRLEFAKPMNTTDGNLTWTYLLGHTSTGVPLTLVGEFSFRDSPSSMTNRVSYWSSTGYPFHYAIFDCHFKDTVVFDTFEFDITGVQEFFSPSVKKKGIAFSKETVVTAKCEAGELSVRHLANFDLVGTNLKVHFHADHEDVLDELQQAYTEVRTRNPEFQPYLKKPLDFLFRFVPTKEMTILEADSIIISITGLFALLFWGPAKLLHLTVFVRGENKLPHGMTVFPPALSDQATIEKSQAKKNHHTIPLNHNDVDLGVLLSNWLDQCDRYQTIVSALQSEVSVISLHQIHGDIVLAVTQLESIANEAGRNTKKEKFQYGIDNHASDKLRANLAELLGCAEEQIGVKISDLRNNIAHVGRPQTLLNTLSQLQLLHTSVALQAVVIGYVLEKVGLCKQTRDKYQDTLIRK